MAPVMFLLLVVLLLSIGMNGARNRIRRPCTETEFSCNDDYCIPKEAWCDNVQNCNDGSDENYCHLTVSHWDAYEYSTKKSCPDSYFTCSDERMCIPMNGICDGYISCSDESDEENCPDSMCAEHDAFKCSKTQCISPEKQCDGITDCKNRNDEKNCEYGAFSASYLESDRQKAVQWMRNQHDLDWGWKENTHKAIVALYLVGGLNNLNKFIKKENDLIAKQLELEVSTFLLRNKLNKKSTTELAAYINALLVICHDPKNFYGFNLVAELKKELEATPEFLPPFSYLTLCNAKEPISEEAVKLLLKSLENSQDHGFALEVQALTIMALTCVTNSDDQYAHLKQNVSEALNSLKKEQMQDGSFGNEYTTALILQVMLANSQEKEKDWNPKSAIQFLRQEQQTQGAFNDFLSAYLILPILNAKSLLDIGKVNCTESLKRPRNSDTVSDIKSSLGQKIVVEYSLFIGDEKDQIHPIVLRIPQSINALELMELAADIDPKYKFKTHQIKGKTYVYEISNLPNNPESNTFWFMYERVENGTTVMIEQSPDNVKVEKKEHLIMWYKTLNTL